MCSPDIKCFSNFKNNRMTIKQFVLVLYANMATFNNISIIYWKSVLLVGKTEYPEKNPILPEVSCSFHKVVSSTDVNRACNNDPHCLQRKL